MVRGESWYDVMQVCLNGHKITSMLKTAPEVGTPFCAECGAATISKCENCETIIRGYHHVPGVAAIGFGKEVPAFCHACGKPYPWTESKLKAARELAEEVEGLTHDERETLKASLDDLVRDTPRTTVAATRFKRLVAKSGKVAVESFRSILVDVLSEAAKKVIFPG